MKFESERGNHILCADTTTTNQATFGLKQARPKRFKAGLQQGCQDVCLAWLEAETLGVWTENLGVARGGDPPIIDERTALPAPAVWSPGGL